MASEYGCDADGNGDIPEDAAHEEDDGLACFDLAEAEHDPGGDGVDYVITPTEGNGIEVSGADSAEGEKFPIREEFWGVEREGCEEREGSTDHEPDDGSRDEEEHGEPERLIDFDKFGYRDGVI